MKKPFKHHINIIFIITLHPALFTLRCKCLISTQSFTAVTLKGDLFYCQLNKTQGRRKSGDSFSTNLPSAVPPLSVSGIPIHGHNRGGGALNIEGNSIWPSSSDSRYTGTTCGSRVSYHINSLN